MLASAHCWRVWSTPWHNGQNSPVGWRWLRIVEACRSGSRLSHAKLALTSHWRRKVRSYSSQPLPLWRIASWITSRQYASILLVNTSEVRTAIYAVKQYIHESKDVTSRWRVLRVAGKATRPGSPCTASSWSWSARLSVSSSRISTNRPA